MADRYCLSCGCHEDDHTQVAQTCICGLCDGFLGDDESEEL